MESSRIFVKNLPSTLTEAEFRKHFGAKGREVTDIKLIARRRIGYVGYKTPGDAADAVKYFNRSFIRMSRVAVELARPIADPSLPTPRRLQRNEVAAPPREPLPPAPVSDSDAQLNSKKRKREDLDESDPKIKEFLEAMHPGQRPRKREDVEGDNSVFDEPAQPVVQMDNESDDEYETIPAKPRHSQQEGAKWPDAGALRNAVADLAADPVADPVTDPDPQIPQQTGEATSTQVRQNDATDDEWLRSRTNRLLDLVDAEESNVITKPVQKVASPGPERESPGPPGTEDHIDGRQDPSAADGDGDDDGGMTPATQGEASDLDLVQKTSRLFVRNLPYSTTEDDLREFFEVFGTLEEVHLPIGSGGVSKGYAMVHFADPPSAIAAFQQTDGKTFQGRILHVLPAMPKKDSSLDEFALSKLPLKKQNLIRKKAEAATSSFNWNALYMNQDAVNASVANRLNISKSALLDPSSSDAAVKQAIAETTIIQDTKAYFAANGVDLEAFKSRQRGDTAILVKNFPYGTTLDELRKLFEEQGTVLRVLMPPTGTIAIVEFAQPAHAKAAFGRLSYRRIKDSILFLEKAPKKIFVDLPQQKVPPPGDDRPAGGAPKLSAAELLERDDTHDQLDTTSLFVRNLNFATTTEQLAEAFKPLEGFISARVKTKTDAKKPGQVLSMGFGFCEFRTKEQAMAALKTMDGHVLHAHTLSVKASHRGLDAAEERRREDRVKKVAGQRTKIVVKNLPFEATKKDVRSLFGNYGQLRSVRVPKKFGNSSRGFAFAEFVSPREAENALNALRDTHLLGRKLVLDFAEAEAVDAEEEIAKMQKKIGGQVNKVALQQLTGRGRRKVNIGEDEEDEA